MVVEDLQKSATPAAEENPIGSSNKKENEVEEGEIIGDANDNRNEEDPSSKISVDAPHPLEHQWTFWFDNPNAKNKAASWGSSMRSVFTFSTVEEFWSVYNNIHHPSKLGVGADFYCFKKDIEPKWEDPVCANGGKWTITCQKGKSDTYWLYTLLAMIGEQFDYGDEICGAVVNIRGRPSRQEKISIWTKNATNEAAQVSIGKQWKEFLDYNESIGFIFHEDAMKDRNPKNKYTA